MYEQQYYEIVFAGDDRIGWSSLLTDGRFETAPTEAVTAFSEGALQGRLHNAEVL